MYPELNATVYVLEVDLIKSGADPLMLRLMDKLPTAAAVEVSVSPDDNGSGLTCQMYRCKGGTYWPKDPKPVCSSDRYYLKILAVNGRQWLFSDGELIDTCDVKQLKPSLEMRCGNEASATLYRCEFRKPSPFELDFAKAWCRDNNRHLDLNLSSNDEEYAGRDEARNQAKGRRTDEGLSIDATVHRNRARQFFKQANLTAAAQELSVLTNADAASESDYEFLAEILERQMRYDEALVMSEFAIERSDQLSILVQHARLLTYGGKWDEALAELNALVEQFPDDPMPLMERCEVNGFTQRWADCARDFLHLKDISPFRNHARLGYVVACDALGQDDVALTMLRKFAHLNQENGGDADLLGPGIEFGMSSSLSESDHRDMLEDFEATPFADEYFGLLIRGMLHYRLNETDHAIELLHEAQRLQGHGGTPVSHSFLSMCHSEKSQITDAARHLQLAKEACRRMCGAAARPLALKTSAGKELGQPTHWYQVQRFRRAIAEAESLANTANTQ